MKTILTRVILNNFYYSTYTIDEKINLKAKLMPRKQTQRQDSRIAPGNSDEFPERHQEAY
jgi:hypothetical protein